MRLIHSIEKSVDPDRILVVPLAIVTDLTATLLNASTVFVSWTMDKTDIRLLNGRFRAFAVSIYENYSNDRRETKVRRFSHRSLDMSTLFTIETNRTELNISHLHSSSKYFISLTVCNDFACGSSSSSLVVETPSIGSMTDSATLVIHPVNKPFHFDCPSANVTRLHSHHEYRCGSKWIHLRFYGEQQLCPHCSSVNVSFRQTVEPRRSSSLRNGERNRPEIRLSTGDHRKSDDQLQNHGTHVDERTDRFATDRSFSSDESFLWNELSNRRFCE